MSDNIFLAGEKVILRPYEPGDEVVYAKLENNPETRRTLFYALPITSAAHKDKTGKFLHDPNTILLTICRTEDGTAIGQTAFFRIDWVGRMATFYIGISDTGNRSKGLGSETTRLMVQYAFETLNLNRVHLHVAVKNKAAVHVYEKTGFIIEGTLREAMYNQGEDADFYVMGILKSDWEKIKKDKI